MRIKDTKYWPRIRNHWQQWLHPDIQSTTETKPDTSNADMIDDGEETEDEYMAWRQYVI